MAVGPCSVEMQHRRVEFVENLSKHVSHLLELLFNIGAITEEDVSFIRGGGSQGERDCMRTLLDVLHGRGEEACRAFLFFLPNFQELPARGVANLVAKDTFLDHLRKHKGILARQHGPTDYFSMMTHASELEETDRFTDITFSRQAHRLIPLQCQHEAAVVGESFRTRRSEAHTQAKTCTFIDVYRGLIAASGGVVTLLSGVAGSGKTTVIRQLVRDWAADPDAQKIVLSLSFRELNLITETRSLQGLLSDHYSHLKPILPELLTTKQSQGLLILDGLDEFSFPLDFEHTSKCSDPERELSVGAMVVNLLKGNLLPGVDILLTSRPHAISKVPQLLVGQFYSVLGFSPDQQRAYFQRSCVSGGAADSLWGFVSSHKPLRLMCHIPAFCWIVSTAIHAGAFCLFPGSVCGEVAGPECLAAEPNAVTPVSSRPITVTEIYCCFLKSIVVFHIGGCVDGLQLDRLQDAPRILKKSRAELRRLGALAFKGLVERRFLFDSTDLDAFSLSCSTVSRAFLVEVTKEDRTSLTYQKGFHFVHTSVQEFLAALYYALESFSGSDPFLGLKPATGLLPPAVRTWLASAAMKLRPPRRVLRTHVKKALHWGEHHQSGHMDLFCRFVCGLLVPKTRFILDGVFPVEPQLRGTACEPPASTAPPSFLQLLRSRLLGGALSPERQLNVCHCLYEACDPMLPQRLRAWLEVLAQHAAGQPSNVSRDWSELAFLLQLSPDLQELRLDAQGLDAEGLRRLLPVLPLFSTLSLGQNPLGPEGAEVLSQALRSPDCHIEKLWVVSTGLGCEGFRILAEGLHDNHTVVDLSYDVPVGRMAINGIGDNGAAHLAKLLKTNRTLRDIRLRDNLVTDKGAELLVEALMENTTLEYLWLFDNKLSKECVRQLKEFSKNRSNLDIKVCY
ncbi:NLR family member X1 isoform X1 [Electrophorus electricus]|uniref:NLR family member X1 isoform X1 n=1 Tax=Electrophorus electricus TaxID=8005 RepID=UPI0015D02730|nr:NLR family member X1 isoform X1 [Electrophorus electricus]